MKGTQDSILQPLPTYALVKLGDKYENIEAVVKSYESKTSGTLLKFHEEDKDLADIYKDAFNKTVYWETYKEGAIITEPDGEYVYVKIEDLQGYKNA